MNEKLTCGSDTECDKERNRSRTSNQTYGDFYTHKILNRQIPTRTQGIYHNHSHLVGSHDGCITV